MGRSSASADGTDAVEILPSGLRLAYSEATAAWLASCVANPLEADLGHLTRLLRDGSQPLGTLARGFVRLFGELHHAGLGADRAEACEALALAAVNFRRGASRLLALIFDVLPPLREVSATRVAEAVELALFDEGVAATLHPLLLASACHREEAYATRVDGIADATGKLHERLGLAPTLAAERLLSAVHAARAIPCCAAPHAKLRCFLEVCAAATTSAATTTTDATLGADELIPACAYALVAARLRHLPSDLRLIELFVTDEHELLGPLGYGLATLHAAASLIDCAAAKAACNEEAAEAEEAGGEYGRARRLRFHAASASPEPWCMRPRVEANSPPPPPPASPAVVRTPSSPAAELARSVERGARWLDSLAAAAHSSLSPSKAERASRRHSFPPQFPRPQRTPPQPLLALPPQVETSPPPAVCRTLFLPAGPAEDAAPEPTDASAAATIATDVAASRVAVDAAKEGGRPAGALTARASPARRHRKQRLSPGHATARTCSTARAPLGGVPSEVDVRILSPARAAAWADEASAGAASAHGCVVLDRSSPRAEPSHAEQSPYPYQSPHLHLGATPQATPPLSRSLSARRHRRQRCTSGASTNRTVPSAAA